MTNWSISRSNDVFSSRNLRFQHHGDIVKPEPYLWEGNKTSCSICGPGWSWAEGGDSRCLCRHKSLISWPRPFPPFYFIRYELICPPVSWLLLQNHPLHILPRTATSLYLPRILFNFTLSFYPQWCDLWSPSKEEQHGYVFFNKSFVCYFLLYYFNRV